MASPSIIANLAAMGSHSVGVVVAASIDSVTGSPDPVTEGNTITWTVSTTNVPDGTSLNWSSNNTADTNPDTGTVTINSDTGTFTMTAVADGVTEGDENITVTVSGTVGGNFITRTSTTVTIQDPAPGAIVSVTETSSSVNEGASATFNVVTSNIPDSTVIGWSIVFGGNVNPAASSADFNQTSGGVTVNSNAATISVPITSDNTTEGAEDFRVLANYSPTSSSQTSGYVTINDTSTTPATPTITSVAGPASVNEGSNATITVSTANIPDSTILNWAINNGTTSNADFGATSGTVTISSNSGTFNIPTVADTTTEGSETFTVTVSGTVSSTPVSGTSANIIINDTSTAPTPTYAVVAPTTINEGVAGTMNVTTTNVVNGTTLYWTVLPSADFATNSGNFTISSNGASFSVIPSADSTTEGTETGTIQIRTGSTSGTIVATDTFNIGDASTTPATFTVSSASAVDEGSNLSVSIGGGAPAGASGDYTMNWVINHISTAAADFSATSGTVTASIVGGNIVGAFNITPTADNTTEGAQTFTVTVSGTIEGDSLSDTSSTITVNDTSLTPVSYTFGGDSTVVEGQTLNFNATRSDGVGSTTIYYQILRTDDSAFSRIDSPTGSITFSADGQVAGSSGTSVNNLYEGAPTGFVGGKVEFFSDSGLTNELANSPHTFTMSNAAPTLVSVVGPSSVNEGSNASVTVTVTNVPDGETLNWAVNNGTTVNADFGSTSGTVTLNGNSGTFNVPISADTTTEGSETFSVDVSGTILSTSLSGSTSNITINDTSTTPSAQAITAVSPSASNVNEGSSVTITVDTENYADGNKLFNYTINPGSGVTAGDFTSNSLTGTVIVNTSGGTGTGNFTITPTADSTTEGSETFTVTVTDASNGSITFTSTTITINDTSVDPVVSIDSVTGPASVNEGASATINVGTTNVPNGTSLNWAVNNVSTVNGDFSSTSGTVTINSNAGSFTIPIVADSTTEGSETFTVTVSGSVTPSVGSGTSQSVSRTSSSITINDTSTTPAPTGSVSFTGASFATEGSGTLGFTFTASVDGTYYYDVNRISGSTGGGEITNPGPSAITISGGTGSVNISFNNDSTTEIGFQGEQFVMRYGTTSNSQDLDTLNFTLYDDDSGISYSSSSINVASNAFDHDISIVRATGDSSSAVTARVVVDGTSTAIGGTFSLSTGTTVRTVSDVPSPGSSETYRVQVYNGNEYIDGPTYTVTTAAAVSYSVTAPASINEGSAGTMNVTTTGVTDGTTLYWLATPSGEFDTATGTVTINSNAGSFTVTPTADSTTEGSETGTITIKVGSLGGTTVATDTFTINDTSTAPAATYSVNAPTLDEQGVSSSPSDQDITVTTTNVPNGTTLYWNITPTAEFDTTSGSFTINSNSGTISVRATRDFITEGTDTYTINVRTGSTSGTIVATNSGNISDTAKATMYNWAFNPFFYVVLPSGSGNQYSFYWDDTFLGQTTGSSITTGGYTYTRGTANDVISDKNGSTTYYEITRS